MKSYFDKVYVVTCKKCEYRHDYIRNHFKENDIEFEFVYGKESNQFIADKVLTVTAKSLISGHIKCLENALNNNYNRILICEDDVNFVENFTEKFKIFISDVGEDWPFLLLGNQFWATRYLQREKIKDNVYKFIWGTGSHCQAINKSVMLDTYQYIKLYLRPIDYCYYDLFNRYTCYCPEEFLADALSKSEHLGNFDKKYTFPSEIIH